MKIYIKYLILFILLVIIHLSYSFSDSNGIWTNSEDINPGTFGADGVDNSTPFAFTNPVMFYGPVTLPNGQTLTLDSQGGVIVNNFSNTIMTSNQTSSWVVNNGNLIYVVRDSNVGIQNSNPKYPLSVSGAISGTYFYDSNNDSYWLNPNKNSYLNTVNAKIFRDFDDLSYYVNPASNSYLKVTNSDAYYSIGSRDFYLDPKDTSKVKFLKANKLYSDIIRSENPNSGNVGIEWEDNYYRYRFGGTSTPRGIRIDSYDNIIGIELNRNGDATFNGAVNAEEFCDENGGNCFTAQDLNIISNVESNWDKNANSIFVYDNVGIKTNSPRSDFDVLGDIRADKFIDGDMSLYYLDPNGISVLKAIRSDVYYSIGSNEYYVDPKDFSKLNNVFIQGNIGVDVENPTSKLEVNGGIAGTIFRDIAEPDTYYINPNFDSQLKDLNIIGELTIGGQNINNFINIPICVGSENNLKFDGSNWQCVVKPIEEKLSTPPTCVGENKALGFDGTSWICNDLSLNNTTINYDNSQPNSGLLSCPLNPATVEVDIIESSVSDYEFKYPGRVKVHILGAGGSGGRCSNCGDDDNDHAASGGAAGGYGNFIIENAQSLGKASITIGSGGVTSAGVFRDSDGRAGGNTVFNLGSYSVTANGGGRGDHHHSSASASTGGTVSFSSNIIGEVTYRGGGSPGVSGSHGSAANGGGAPNFGFGLTVNAYGSGVYGQDNDGNDKISPSSAGGISVESSFNSNMERFFVSRDVYDLVKDGGGSAGNDGGIGAGGGAGSGRIAVGNGGDGLVWIEYYNCN